MSLLIPKFHPVVWGFIAAFYVLCLFFGGESNPEVSFASVGLAIGLGVALAAGAVKEAVAARRAKKDREALEKAQAKRLKDLEAGMADIVDPAKERLKNPEQYQVSQAAKDEQSEGISRQVDAQLRADELATKREAQRLGPYGSGRQFQMMDYLRKRRADAVAGGRLGIERQSAALAEAKKRADEALVTNYERTKAGMAPMPVASGPGIVEGLLGTVGTGLTAAATGGMFAGGGGGGGKTPTPEPGPAAPSADAVNQLGK